MDTEPKIQLMFEEWLEADCSKPDGLSESHWIFIVAYMKKAFEAGYREGFDHGHDYAYG